MKVNESNNDDAVDNEEEAKVDKRAVGLFNYGIKATHIEGMHHNLLSVHQVCTGGESGEEQIGIFTSVRQSNIQLSCCSYRRN